MLSSTPLLPFSYGSTITYEELFPNTVDQFLQLFSDKLNLEKIYNGGMPLNFELKNGDRSNNRISPILKLATPEDAKELVAICREVYEGTYPYREMQDEQVVLSMLKSPNHYFILFKDTIGNIMGSFRCALDFKNKKGYMGGFMLRKPYQKSVDVVKAIVGSYVWMWSTFSNKILVWYCENRTAHSTSQYMTAVCGIKTVGILPNKDIFYGIIESDVMGVIYCEKVLSYFRSPQRPLLIPHVLNCFFHVRKLYKLEKYTIFYSKIKLDYKKVQELSDKIKRTVHQDQFGYETITLSLPYSDSYFTILHTIHLQNLEKAEYQVENVEELYSFLKEILLLINEKKIRYCELFASAYKPDYQTILYQLGFVPRGYVPCWKYNKETGFFEDYILFNHYQGIVTEMKLWKEGQDLLSMIKLNIN
jgi:hypothetical protein